MEGVGARLGRSSTRYGPVTVFTGPVRKWKKKWVHISPSNNNNSSSSSNHSQNHQSSVNGTSNGNNVSHLLLFKWTPISQSQNGNNGDSGDKNSVKEDAVVAPEEPPRRKFRYMPIALLEEQKKEAAEKAEDETEPGDTDPSLAEPAAKSDGFDEKPDINDVPMEENQEGNKIVQDLNESTLDLSLGLTAHDGDPDSNMDQSREEEKLERVNSK
ncbi:hypothetical protein SLEP1_g14431 [Rubroshorea leprosula]|uniref:Uncharacterized protein n=1 Tax=Rubroshorea leprosula TaxID=152421 RepID=A0AAV5ISV6_9ROSI|nr:hypothetical protein SLEP1_g14431 [Rubroshorea leprosula]